MTRRNWRALALAAALMPSAASIIKRRANVSGEPVGDEREMGSEVPASRNAFDAIADGDLKEKLRKLPVP